MLIELTNQVVDISLDNIKEIQKKSIWWDTGWTDNYISVEYKTGFIHKIKCDSREDVEKDYNTIVNLLDFKKEKFNLSNHSKSVANINKSFDEWCKATGVIEYETHNYYSLLSMLFEAYEMGFENR